MKYTFISQSKDITFQLGQRLADLFNLGDIVTLTGDLGAGKTTLTQGIAKGLKVEDRVISPTFNIMKTYFKATKPLFHIDAYRLEDANKDIGLEEFIGAEGIAVIEWPQYIAEYITMDVLMISLIHRGDDKREISLSATTAHYQNIIEKIRGEFK